MRRIFAFLKGTVDGYYERPDQEFDFCGSRRRSSTASQQSSSTRSRLGCSAGMRMRCGFKS
jgi:hypothetical protein